MIVCIEVTRDGTDEVPQELRQQVLDYIENELSGGFDIDDPTDDGRVDRPQYVRMDAGTPWIQNEHETTETDRPDRWNGLERRTVYTPLVSPPLATPAWAERALLRWEVEGGGLHPDECGGWDICLHVSPANDFAVIQGMNTGDLLTIRRGLWPVEAVVSFYEYGASRDTVLCDHRAEVFGNRRKPYPKDRRGPEGNCGPADRRHGAGDRRAR